MSNKITILGQEYKFIIKAYDEDPLFEKLRASGYCDTVAKQIVICDMHTFPEFKDESEEYIEIIQKQFTRHEIVHAFLEECGLSMNTYIPEDGWARNEEMVDWIAIKGPKIFELWKELDLL